ncbi:IGF-like family receptor 1 [Anoplopoma fimbria]|uniref:IGF-like family receptor 1 n=1 Tax=Anoplopoma fimbria TaxID=229290 RepID=UPI0023EC8068|nr:IGF-like family receptor 1 [Anoplopoma fimbria]
MGHSEKCPDLTTFWNNKTSTCMPCTEKKVVIKPGYGFSPNCGYADDGGRHEPTTIRCKANSTFNDGSRGFCQPCAACPSGFTVSSPCSTTSNTQCQDAGRGTTGDPVTEPTTWQQDPGSFGEATQTNQGSSFKPNAATILTPPYPDQAGHDVAVLWAVPLVIIISIVLVGVCAFLICMKRKRGQHPVLSFRRSSSYITAGFSPLPASSGNNDLEHILSPSILSAPLQTMLDNLDVLEELVILLDPESQGVKNTKHLASHCSFPATWITYTYSMKDSKSPLKAVLEGVTSRYPDWTVGHLAKILKSMERNDAIAVLAKLGLNVMQV